MTEKLQAAEDDARDLAAPADNTEPSPEAAQVLQQEDAPAKEEPKEPRHGGLFDDKRAEIAAKAKAARQATDAAPDVEVISDQQKRMYGNVETEADRLNPEDPQPAKDVKVEDIPAPQKKVLKVNGREVEVDEAQIEDHARRSLAADDIIGQAKRERDEARQLLADLQKERAIHSAAQTQQPKPTNATAEDSKPATNAELDEVIDAIQVGTKEEAAQALAKYGDQLVQRVQQNLGNLDERVAAITARAQDDARVKTEAEATLASFRAENTDFENSTMRQAVLFEETVQVMAEKMIEIGVKPETLQQYAEKNGLAPQAAIGAAYRQLRSDPRFGEKLPDPATNLKTAATRVREGLGLPSPAPKQETTPAPAPDTTHVLAERTERKQAMQPQPRRANVSPANDPAPQLSKEQKDRLAVQRMRVARRGR
jgi:NTP pyrophosphatase (non-canonical NTP hydrolase)